MLLVVRTTISSVVVIFIPVALLICICGHRAVGQEAVLDDEITRYMAILEQRPDDAEAHRDLSVAYAKKGMLDRAKDQFERAMKIEYRKGYESGGQDAIRKEGVRIYGSYLALSIAGGLFIAAVIVSIMSWPEMADRLKARRKNARIRAFIRSINARLTPELRDRAIEIAERKEKLRDAIGREGDPGLKEAASSVLPRLDALTKQAALLLELQHTLSDYTQDMDPGKLAMLQGECDGKLRKETDRETKRALEYELNQIENKQANYSKSIAKIRTCDAVLGGIVARIDATSLDLMTLPSVLIKKQEFFEKISAELDDEISLTRNAAETVMEGPI